MKARRQADRARGPDGPQPPAASSPVGADPSRDEDTADEFTPIAPLTCPACGKEWCVELKSIVGKDQRITIAFAPIKGELIQAQVIGEKLKLIDKVFKDIAREDGGKVRSYIESICTRDDGTLEFHLMILAVDGKK